MKCAHCGSLNTQAGLNRYQCLDCGKLSDFEGNAVETGPDADTRAAIERTLEPRTTNVVGNLADLQRAGAAAVAGESNAFEAGVAAAPTPAPGPAVTEGDEVTTTKSSSKDK